MRNGRGSRSQAARKDAASAGAQYGSPTARPAITSSNAAASRTVRARAPLVARPIGSPYIGAPEILPRDGFSPTMPQQLAGMRIEPPPSEPWASGTSPADTADADPRWTHRPSGVGSHGVTAGGAPSGSV